MTRLRAFARQSISIAQKHQRNYSAPTDGSIPAAKVKYVPTEGTYPKGFVVGSAHAGVKPSNTKFNDLTLIASRTLCDAAAVFTVNAFKAAPVMVSKHSLFRGAGRNMRGVVINSGCANAVTGIGGLEDAITMAKEAGKYFPKDETKDEIKDEIKDDPNEDPNGNMEESYSKNPLTNILMSDSLKNSRMLVMSTGVIGQRLPISRITSRMSNLYDSLGETHDHWLGAAKAICTTDTFPKLISRKFTLPSTGEVEYCMAGMSKGAGMIHPNMATLLSVICTDAKVLPMALRSALREATNVSFNSISIDGDTSTNDTVNLFANGAAAPARATAVSVIWKKQTDRFGRLKQVSLPKSEQSQDYVKFVQVLTQFMEDLAKLVVRDGEGATKFVTIRVQGSVDDKLAKDVAISIARSPLVKTALYGKDANWGRILCAIGYSRARKSIRSEHTSVSFVPADGSEELKLLTRGEPEEVDEVRAKAILEMEDLEILVRLNDVAEDSDQTSRAKAAKGAKGSAVMWTCDFSHEYVTINGDYRT